MFVSVVLVVSLLTAGGLLWSTRNQMGDYEGRHRR
jgi:hypothetical protein